MCNRCHITGGASRVSLLRTERSFTSLGMLRQGRTERRPGAVERGRTSIMADTAAMIVEVDGTVYRWEAATQRWHYESPRPRAADEGLLAVLLHRGHCEAKSGHRMSENP
jgi:hypothetical protein